MQLRRCSSGNYNKGVFALLGDSRTSAQKAAPPLRAARERGAGCRAGGLWAGGPAPPLARQRPRVLLTTAARAANRETGHLLRWLMLAPRGVRLNKYLILSRKYRGVRVYVSLLS